MQKLLRLLLSLSLAIAPLSVSAPPARAQFDGCAPGLCGSAAAAACDASFAKVVYLASFEQAQASTVNYTEQSAFHANVVFSSPVGVDGPSQSNISATQFEYGTDSARSNNTTGWTTPDSANWDLSDTNASEFTIEYSYYQSTRAAANNFDTFNHLWAFGQFSWQSRHDGPDWKFFFSQDGTTINTITAAGAVGAINTWTKYAITKNSAGLIQMYVNGTRVASSTPVDSTFFHSNLALVGGGSAAAQTSYMDNARITKGVARYTGASYTTATAAFPTQGCTPCASYALPSTVNLVAWIDACVSSSFTLSAGAVQTAVDQSANGYVFGSGSVGASYLATGFNSRPTLQFSGSATQQSLNYATAALGAGNTLTIFAACTLATDANGFHANGPLMSYTAAAATGAYDNVGSFGLINLGAAANITFDRNAVTQSTVVPYDTKMRVIFTLKSDGTRVIYINGVAVSTVAGAVNNWVSPGYLSMGGSKFDSSFFGGNYAGLVSEWGIYSSYSDATAVGLLDTYLKNKWGM